MFNPLIREDLHTKRYHERGDHRLCIVLTGPSFDKVDNDILGISSHVGVALFIKVTSQLPLSIVLMMRDRA